MSDANKRVGGVEVFRPERNGHGTSSLQHVQRDTPAEEHVEFKKRSAEKDKEKPTPTRMQKQTTSDSARPYGRDHLNIAPHVIGSVIGLFNFGDRHNNRDRLKPNIYECQDR